MRDCFDIVIVGAGVAGLTAAALLSQDAQSRKYRLTVVDAGERPAHDPGADVALRVSAIATGSAGVLHRAGAWEYVHDTRACAYEGMRVWAVQDLGHQQVAFFEVRRLSSSSRRSPRRAFASVG